MKPTEPMWNEVAEAYEPANREIEEQVETRRKQKCLADCGLPVGFRLATPHAKQFWIENQLVWGFCLAWAPVDRLGNRLPDEYFHVSRYDWRISDDVQVCWALSDFIRELVAAGIRLGDLKEQPTPNSKVRTIREPLTGWHRAQVA